MRSFVTMLSVILAFNLQAQQVHKCCNTTNSSFLLGSADYARHNQGIYLPSDFQITMAGSITRLYFRYGTSNIANGNTLTDLTISLLQSQQTSHINGQFITGHTPVLHRDTFTIAPGVADQWFHIDLDQPFPYDPALSLIVDILFDQSERTMTCRSVSTPGRKLNNGDPLSPVGTTFSDNLHDIGFDLDTHTGMILNGPMISMLYPNPATDVFQMSFDRPLEFPAQAAMIDASGRILLDQMVPAGSETTTFNVSAFAPGVYLIRLDGEDGSSITRQFVRE